MLPFMLLCMNGLYLFLFVDIIFKSLSGDSVLLLFYSLIFWFEGLIFEFRVRLLEFEMHESDLRIEVPFRTSTKSREPYLDK